MGNACFKSNQLEQAILAYENALKLNPSDMETKYNLAMAKKQQKNKGGGKNDQKQDKKIIKTKRRPEKAVEAETHKKSLRKLSLNQSQIINL